MALIQPKTGFHTGSSGGNLDGITADYIIPLLHSGKDVTIVAADTTAGLYDACVAAKNYQNTTSVLCWRRTDQRKNGGFDFDALANNFSLSPEQNAELHWQAYQQEIPPDLLPHKDILELIILNEIRGQNTNEPVYDDLHIGEYLGRFALHYRTLTDWRLLFFGFAAGEPDADVWGQPSMLDFLRLCGERPHDTGIALHEYSYTISDILDGYPYKIGRYQFLHDVCDDNGIAPPRIVISEWGWALDDAPAVPQAMADVETVYREYAKHPNIAGGAIWWLGPDFGGIANKIQPLIRPLGEYIIATNYDVEIDTPQPPGNGQGGSMTTYQKNDIVTIQGWQGHKILSSKIRVLHNDGVENVYTPFSLFDIPGIEGLDVRGIQLLVSLEGTVECDENPNPPDPQPPPEDSEYRPLVIDVSHWQGVIDFATMAAQNVRAVMIKATEGETWVDPDFADNWSNAEPNFGNLRMPYHFYRFGADPIKQADHFVDTVINIAGSWAAAFVVDVEDTNTAAKRDDLKLFLDLVEYRTGFVPLIYTASWWWVPRLGGTTWANNYGLIEAEYQFDGTDSNKWPITINDAFLDKLINPTIAADWQEWEFWQFTSKGNAKAFGATSSYIDVQIYNGTLGELKALVTRPSTIDKPPTPPPTGKTYQTTFMRGEPGIWRVIRRVDGSGEDIWELPLMSDSDVRVKNTNEGEWYEYRADGVYRLRDTSPAPDSMGNERLYLLSINGVLGGKIAPAVAEVGKTYSYTNEVQFKRKSDCQNLSENSGLAPSTFLLKEVLDNYTFPETGFKVDRLYVTVQTGEVQLYGVKNGRLLGWIGGGANQDNNVWGGEIAEVYFDREIPQNEPPQYCN